MELLRRYGIQLSLFSAFVLLSLFAALRGRPALAEAVGKAAVQAPTVVLDAGHGGEDGGATTADGVPESTLNLQITLRTDALLKLLGYDTVLVRADDRAVYSEGARTIAEKKVSDIRNRVALVNSTPNALLISIHQNFFPESQYAGAQVFSAPTAGSERLAEIAQELLCNRVDPANHRKSKQVTQSVYLMNHISCPAILAECGFLSNPREAAALQTPGWQLKLAMALTAAANLYTQERIDDGSKV